MLLSFRRQILWETPFLPTPGSVSVPTSRPPSLVPPPCLFAASPHAPEWLQFWGAMSCFPFWERGKRQCLPRVVHSLLRIGHPAAPHPAVYAWWSIMHEHHLQLQTDGVISDNKTALLTKKQGPWTFTEKQKCEVTHWTRAALWTGMRALIPWSQAWL